MLPSKLLVVLTRELAILLGKEPSKLLGKEPSKLIDVNKNRELGMLLLYLATPMDPSKLIVSIG